MENYKSTSAWLKYSQCVALLDSDCVGTILWEPISRPKSDLIGFMRAVVCLLGIVVIMPKRNGIFGLGKRSYINIDQDFDIDFYGMVSFPTSK